MKAALAHLSASKESVAHVAELHQHKMQMLQEMQAKGVAAVAKEKQCFKPRNPRHFDILSARIVLEGRRPSRPTRSCRSGGQSLRQRQVSE